MHVAVMVFASGFSASRQAADVDDAGELPDAVEEILVVVGALKLERDQPSACSVLVTVGPA